MMLQFREVQGNLTFPKAKTINSFSGTHCPEDGNKCAGVFHQNQMLRFGSVVSFRLVREGKEDGLDPPRRPEAFFSCKA